MFRNNEFFNWRNLFMMKWSMWVRVVIGVAAVLLCLISALFLQPWIGEYGLFLILPGAVVFIYLNPELWRGE